MSGNMSINGNQGPDWSNMSDGPNMSGGHGDNDRQIAAMEQEIQALMASRGSPSPQMGNADCMPGNGAFGNAGSGFPSQSWGAQPWAGGQGSNAGGSFPSQSWGAPSWNSQPWAGGQGGPASALPPTGLPTPQPPMAELGREAALTPDATSQPPASTSELDPDATSQPPASTSDSSQPSASIQPQASTSELDPDAISQPPASTSDSSQPPASTSASSFPNGNETEYQNDETQAAALEAKAKQALSDGAGTSAGPLTGDDASAEDDLAAAAKLQDQAAQVATNESEKTNATGKAGLDNFNAGQAIWSAGDAGPGHGGQAQYNQFMDAAKAEYQGIANDSNANPADQDAAAKRITDVTTMETQTQLGDGKSQAWQDAFNDLNSHLISTI